MWIFKKKAENIVTTAPNPANFDVKASLEAKAQELAQQASGKMQVKVLGPGCAKCQSLSAHTKSALSEMQIEHDFAHISDYAQIASYGVMSTPALVVNDQVLSVGQDLSVAQIKELIQKVSA